MTSFDMALYSAAGIFVAVGILFLLFLAFVVVMRWKARREEDAAWDVAYSKWVRTRSVAPMPGQRWAAVYDATLHVLRVTDDVVVYSRRDEQQCRTVARQDWQAVVDTDNYYLLSEGGAK